MLKDHQKFLDFNGQNIYFVTHDGMYWIALKPICKALGIHYDTQRENLRNDENLGQLAGVHRVVAADGKLREMVCLPEEYIYGWIFSLQSDSQELKLYKLKCYQVLFNYFHGSLTDRASILKEKTKWDRAIETAEEELVNSDAYKKLVQAREERSKAKKELAKMDRDFVSQQMPLWEFETN